MSATITPTELSNAELGKRFPIFATVEAPCPICGKKISRDDLTEDYPVVGKPFTAYLYCDDCNEEVPVKMVINVTYSLA